TFYASVRKDDLLGPIFQAIIQDNWPTHLDKMYRFWETVLLNKHTYMGHPFPPHLTLKISAQHFERWLSLFHKALEQFEGPKTEEANGRAKKMAAMFVHKIAWYNGQNTSI